MSDVPNIGLNLVEFESTVEAWADLTEYAIRESIESTFTGKSYVVAWLDNQVQIGTWDKGFNFHGANALNFNHLQRLRVFNDDQELHVWKAKQAWAGRLRTDKYGGNMTKVVIAKQNLFGTDQPFLYTNEGYTGITEDRGTTLVIPFLDLTLPGDLTDLSTKEKEEELKKRVSIKTHNYIGFNELSQAGYEDSRFVAFYNNDKKLA